MNKSANQTYLIIGKIGAPFGVKGWLKIQSYTEFNASMLNYQPWHISDHPSSHDFQSIEIEDSKIQSKGIIVKIKGINSPEVARTLTGKYISTPKHQLPALNAQEYYWSDLEGLTVINQHGEILGTVIYLIETGANDVLIVKNAKEHAIPFLQGKVVTAVDLQKREIHVNWEIL